MIDFSQLRNRLAAKLTVSRAKETIRSVSPFTGDNAVNAAFLSYIQSKQWAMSSPGLRSLAGHAHSQIDIGMEDFFELRPATEIDAAGVATIHIHNALVDSCPAIYEKLGLVTRYSTISADIRDVTQKGAKRIVLIVNSPGGTVSGVKECADLIAASKVPVTAYCNGQACSAAYYLIAGAKRIAAAPSATVGNIGTIMSWADDTEFWASIGIEWKALVNDGADLKSTGHLEPDATQIAFLQESVNESGKEFKEHVQKHRPGINAEVFRAGWYSGDKAKSLGLVDEIGTREAATKASTSPTPSTPSATAKPFTTISKTSTKHDPMSFHPGQFSAAKPAPVAPPKAAEAVPLPSAVSVPVALAEGFISAAQFATPDLKMERTEFEKLSASDKTRFVKEGGKLVVSPESSLAVLKAQATAAGVLSKPSFEALKGMERVKASMAWESKRKEFVRSTATRQIDDEELAGMSKSKDYRASFSTSIAATAGEISRDARINARAKELESQIS
jgi:ClpP class serine protease